LSFLSQLVSKYGEYRKVSSNPNEVRFCCPYCIDIGKPPDTKFHLYIALDKKVGYCFRCGKVLKFSQSQFPLISRDVIKVKLRKPRHILSRLPKSIPITKHYNAWQFLRLKFKDVLTKEELLQKIDQFDLQVCIDVQFPHLYNRIMIPIYFEGKVVACQFRSIFGQEPKYLSYSFSQANLKEFLFNYDTAKDYDEVWLMEGVFDVIPTLNNAVALFGKDVSKPQFDLLTNSFRKVIVALDPDAKHEAYKIAKTLVLNGSFDRVMICELPLGKDPGDLGRDILNCLIKPFNLFQGG